MTLRLLAIVNIWLIWQVGCDPSVVYKFTNIKCLCVPKFCSKFDCSIKAVNWNEATAYMDFHLLLSVRNVSIHFKVLKKDYANQYHPFLIDVRFNLCDVISKRNYLFYGTLVWNTMKRFTNLNHSCPLNGHLLARNLYLNTSYTPIFPLGVYQLFLNFTEAIDNRIEHIGVIKVYGQSMERVSSKRKG